MTRQRFRTPQGVLSRFISGRKAGLGAAIATFGIPATIASLAGLAGIPIICGFGVMSVVVGLGVAYVTGRGQILPRNLIDEMKNPETPYACAFCTETTLAEACELTKPHYRDEYVESEQAEEWRHKNPKAFVHLLNRDRELVASFGVLALTPSFTDQFFKGNLTDLLLRSADVLDFETSRRARELYISGVVVREPDTHLGKKRAAAMLWVMLRYLEKVYGVRRKRTLYAIAVTPASERLMKSVGFSIGCKGQGRQDGYPLYCFEITPDSWKELKTRVRAFGDSSATCICSF